MKDCGKGIGFGKTILFGEHFVVYGLPAVVASLNAITTAEVRKANSIGIEINDQRQASPGYKAEKLDQMRDSLSRILAALDIPEKNFSVTFGGDLCAASGVGASAASCTAFARALNDLFELDLDDNRINELAYEGEKAYHGKPSGIDNTASTFGGVLAFQRDVAAGTHRFKPVRIGTPLTLLLADTGKTSNTAAVVEDVRLFFERDPLAKETISRHYADVFGEAVSALEEGNIARVAELMTINQSLLRDIGVSSDLVESVRSTALRNGAIASKVTGTGRGGLVLSLFNDAQAQQKAYAAYAAMGITSYPVTVG